MIALRAAPSVPVSSGISLSVEPLSANESMPQNAITQTMDQIMYATRAHASLFRKLFRDIDVIYGLTIETHVIVPSAWILLIA